MPWAGFISLYFTLAHPDQVRRLVHMGNGGAPVPPTPELLTLILFNRYPLVWGGRDRNV